MTIIFHLGQMEKVVVLGVPILKHFRVVLAVPDLLHFGF